MHWPETMNRGGEGGRIIHKWMSRGTTLAFGMAYVAQNRTL